MGTSTPASLMMAVGALAGVSSGSSSTIPALLVADAPGVKRLSDLTPVTRLEDATLGSIDCYRIQNGIASDRPMPDLSSRANRTLGAPTPTTMRHIVDTTIVWIDKATYLVRRIDKHTQFPQFRTEAVTSFDPVVNGPIADSLFLFIKPPGDR